MPTRRIMELVIVTEILFLPARATARTWGRKQLATRPPGSLRYVAGEIITTIL